MSVHKIVSQQAHATVANCFFESALRDNRAFGFCQNLEYVIIPKSCEYVGDYAFNGIENLYVYCEVSSQPESWHKNWAYNNKTSHIYYYSETSKDGYWHYD